MELIKNKRIGKILLIVEGGKHEFSLIKKIFEDILGYKRIEKRRNRENYYVSQTDSHSIVGVINTKTSNIGSIDEKEYLDNIFAELIEKYDFDLTNAAIYYVFDRDPESNKDKELIRKFIRTLKNSRENDDNMLGGALILSYPAIEAYEVSNFISNSYHLCAKLGIDVKKYINDNAKDISMNKINEETILHACMELKKCLAENNIELDYDDFSNTNEAVFEAEEENFKSWDSYFLLSMMSVIFLDLGIIRE